MRAKNSSQPTYRPYNTEQTLDCYEDSRRSTMENKERLHFLGECCANMQIRYFIFGANLMQPSELRKVEPSTLLRFARATKRFS